MNTQIKSVDSHSLDSSEWSNETSLPFAKAAIALCSWRGEIYCIGGETADEVHTADVFSRSRMDDLKTFEALKNSSSCNHNLMTVYNSSLCVNV